MNIVPNLVKTGSNAGGPAPKNEIAIMIVEDILVYPSTNPLDEVSLLGNFVMKPGKSAIFMYSTKSKTEAPIETDGSEDAMSFKHKFMAQVPGNDTATKSWIQKITGQNLIVAHKACGDTKWEIMGSPCSPLQLKPVKQDNNEGRHYVLNFEAYAGSHSIAKDYTGVIPKDEPVAVTSLTAIDADVEGKIFQLPATSGTIAFASDPQEDCIISVIGGGGVTPATLQENSNVLVKEPWQAIAGAFIQLEVFYTSQAGAFYIERARG